MNFQWIVHFLKISKNYFFKRSNFFLILMSFICLTLISSFQNCSTGKFQGLDQNKLENLSTSSSCSAGNILDYQGVCRTNFGHCTMNGQVFASGTSLQFWENSVVSSGNTCNGEMRTCQEGSWTSGSFQNLTCSVIKVENSPLPQSTDIPQATSSSSPSSSPSNPSSSPLMSPVAQKNCIFNNQTIREGTTVLAFSTDKVQAKQSCTPFLLSSICKDGHLNPSLDNAFPTCSKSCTFNGTTIASGSSTTAYDVASVPYNKTCEGHSASISCTEGVWSANSANFKYATCSSSQPGDILALGFWSWWDTNYDYAASFMVQINGTLKSAGNNYYGHLGNNISDGGFPYNTLQYVGTNFNDVTDVVTGGIHSCAISNGKISCWGYNGHGELGRGTTNSAVNSSPLEITTLSQGVTKISAGQLHTCAIQNGKVFCWGYNAHGQLGNGSVGDAWAPTQVVNSNDGENFESGVENLSSGGVHTCAIKAGKLYCWGYNGHGEVGDGSIQSRSIPTRVDSNHSDYQMVTAGLWHTCATRGTKDNNATYCWGYNGYASLGSGNTASAVGVFPTLVVGLGNKVSKLTSSNSSRNTCAIDELSNGTKAFKCWGYNEGNAFSNSQPTLYVTSAIDILSSTQINAANISYVALNGHTTCVILTNGNLYCMGKNSQGAPNSISSNGPLLTGSMAPSVWSLITVPSFF